MKSMQQVIIEAIELNLDEDEFTLIVESEYANTGLIRVVPDGYYTSCRHVSYTFQKHGAMFSHHCHTSKCNVAEKTWHISYDNEQDFHILLDDLINWLQQEKGDL